MTSILLGSLLFVLLAAIAGSIIAAFMLKRPESPINHWRRKSFKSMLCRAYSDGLISSFQLHELAVWADQLPKLDRKKPSGGYASKSVSYKPQFALALAFMLIGAGTIKSEAQTNAPSPIPPLIPAAFINLDFMTNLPLQGDLTKAQFGIGAGMLLKNGTVENETKLDVYFKTNWVASASEQNAPAGSVIDSFSVHFGYRKAYPNAEVMAQILGRKNFGTLSLANAFTPASWQGGVSLDANWLPISGGKVFAGTSFKFLTASQGNVFKKPVEFEWNPIIVKICF